MDHTILFELIRHANIWNAQTWVRCYLIKVTSIENEEEGFSREKQSMLSNKEMGSIAVRLHQQISTANVYSQLHWQTLLSPLNIHNILVVLSPKHVAPLSLYYNSLWFLQSKVRFIFLSLPLTTCLQYAKVEWTSISSFLNLAMPQFFIFPEQSYPFLFKHWCIHSNYVLLPTTKTTTMTTNIY